MRLCARMPVWDTIHVRKMKYTHTQTIQIYTYIHNKSDDISHTNFVSLKTCLSRRNWVSHYNKQTAMCWGMVILMVKSSHDRYSTCNEAWSFWWSNRVTTIIRLVTRHDHSDLHLLQLFKKLLKDWTVAAPNKHIWSLIRGLLYARGLNSGACCTREALIRGPAVRVRP